MGQTRQPRIRPPRPTGDAFRDLVRLARCLQGPRGCAWDRAQTLESLLPYLVEETWEIFEGIKRRDRRLLAEELGDALYTLLCLALIAERQGWLRLNAVLSGTRRKMVRRHGHVFSQIGRDGVRFGIPKPGRRQTGRAREDNASPASALGSWQSAKRKERRAPSTSKRVRPVILASWERLRRDPAAADQLAKWLRDGRPRRPSGRRARSTGRS